MKHTVDIIIVNWNAGNQLRECLESIINANRKGFDLLRVVVVDNASTDCSIKKLEDLDLQLTVIRNKENRGFAVACNQGAQGSRADYLLFLNPDTRLFAKSLEIPILFMGQPENKKVAITSIQLVNDSGDVMRTCAHFPTPSRLFYGILGLDHLFPRFFPTHFMVEWDHQESREVDQVMGAFFLVRHAIFKSLGGFDELFFVYMEDLDFSLRARQTGWKTVYLSDTMAYHKGGGVSEQVKGPRLFYNLRSRILYGFKHFTFQEALILMLATLFVEPLARTAQILIGQNSTTFRELIKGYKLLWRSVREILRYAKLKAQKCE